MPPGLSESLVLRHPRPLALSFASRVDWHVRLMGELAVEFTSRHWQEADFGSRRPRILLALLAVDDGRLVTMDRIVDTLWPDAPPKRPAANVATLVSRLRATLDSQVIAGGRQGYRLGERVVTDLTDAVTLVSTAESRLAAGDGTVARTAANRALTVMHDEVAGRLMMQAFDAMAQPALALRAYERLRVVLARDLGVSPAAPTQELYLAILRRDRR